MNISFISFTGFLTIFIGALVIIGWLFGIEQLIQLNPEFVPMQFNTALGFIISGGICLGISRKSEWVRYLSIFLFFLSTATFIQYVFQVNFHIDEFFIKHYVTVKTSHPGRMAPMTAVSFMILSILGLLINFRKEWGELKEPFKWILSALLFYFSVSALIGYLIELDTVFGWQRYTQMAAHTSFCFLALSLGFFSLLVFENAQSLGRRRFLPFVVAIFLIVLFVITAFEVRRDQRRSIKDALTENTYVLENKIDLKIKEVIFAFMRLSERISYHTAFDKAFWERDTDQYLKDFSFYDGFYFYIFGNTKGWSNPKSEIDNIKYLTRNLYPGAFETRWDPRTPNVIYYLQPVKLKTDVKGVSIAMLDLSKQFSEIFDRSEKHSFGFNLRYKDKMLYSSFDPKSEKSFSPIGSRREINFYDLPWTVQFYARNDIISASNSVIPEFIVGLGALIAILAGLVSFFYQKMRVMRDRAEIAGNSKTLFLANMSHEIRTPLNGILGMTTLLKDEVKDPSAKEKLNIIDKSGAALLSIINDILDLSKIDAGKYHIEKTSVHLATLIKDQVELFTPIAQSKGINIVVKDQNDSIDYIETDGLRLRQILGNLLSNAIKFSENSEVEINVNHGIEYIGITVKDFGIGISKENLRGLFKDFTQVESTATRNFEGTGLGLSISKKLSRLLGGEITVKSELGKGTEFTLIIPYSPSKPKYSDHHGGASRYDTRLAESKPLRILCVDDNDVNLKVATSFLKKLGYDSDTANSGKLALDLVEEKSYDLILMDCHMPGMDGFEVTKKIRSFDIGSEITIVALSASSLEEDIEKCKNAGMDDFLAKPLSLSSLQEMIENLGR